MMNFPPSLFGLGVVASAYLTVEKSRVVERSWRERFWSWAWRPWVKTKVVYWSEPDPDIYRAGEDWCFVVAHPQTVRRLQEQLAADELYRRGLKTWD